MPKSRIHRQDLGLLGELIMQHDYEEDNDISSEVTIELTEESVSFKNFSSRGSILVEDDEDRLVQQITSAYNN